MNNRESCWGCRNSNECFRFSVDLVQLEFSGARSRILVEVGGSAVVIETAVQGGADVVADPGHSRGTEQVAAAHDAAQGSPLVARRLRVGCREATTS